MDVDSDDQKKYTLFENTLQLLNKKYIALPDEEIKRNNKLLKIIDQIIQKMRSKSALFDKLFEKKYYGGSFYDGLKVGKPSEYDLDCVLCLPKAVEAAVKPSDKPGYVHVTLNLKALENKVDEAPKYVGLEKLVQGNSLSALKVKSWMEGLVASVLPEKGSNFDVKIDETTYHVKAKFKKSGPAVTIKLQGNVDGKDLDIDVDLVPCFKFFDDQWPKGGYKKNPSLTRNTFFVVPKTPDASNGIYWRLSFQEQEKELISGYAVMKPTIRLLKKMRDRYEHKIASYFIKTVFLWELEKIDKNLWQKSLSYVFVTMLKKYQEYVADKNIPYYWNSKYNLIEDIPDSTASCIANTLKKMSSDIDRLCYSTDPYGILQYFLLQNECNVETFKLEAPLGKKQLKQLGCVGNKPAENLLPQSSSVSSFEEVAEPSASVSKLEALCENIASDQKRILELLENLNCGVGRLESKVKELSEEVEAEKGERTHLVKMVQRVNKKIYDMEKKEAGNNLEDLLTGNVILERTAEFNLL